MLERIAELEAEVELLRAQLERERAAVATRHYGTTGTTTAFTGASTWAELARAHRSREGT